ncbi:hypothetical protein EMPS_00411 [Entomortierella parvispora]|uniref:ACB domain-containing protein n=1 Tax=Entomortierella parvispora TaxID=205924 RepID=A0A9P3LRY5_9FUNG|nr:hypothetical protein EMPS_00411 [Entomortierella parvispora]
MLADRFKSASAFMAANRKLNLPSSTKLALYADFKLATEGPCTQPRPSLIEFEKSAKWKAWKEAEAAFLKEQGQDPENTQDTLSTRAMISYIQRVEDGQWGWTFDPSESLTLELSSTHNTAFSSTGDQDLDELNEYLGVDKDEISAEELLARPYVPIQGQEMESASMTASGISTMARPEEDDLEEEDVLASAKKGSIESLREAIAADPSLVSATDDMGMTLLHWACDRGQLDKVKALVEEYHADVNAQDLEGMTPLHYVYMAGWPEVGTYIKSVPGVDLGIADHSGMLAEEYED